MPRLIGTGFLTVLAVGSLLGLGDGQALASHVQCGDVITQDTTLDSDLTDCPGTAIRIGADGITLDLDGHTIDASADRPDVGIANEAGYDDITVESGRVQGYRYGIRLVDTTGSHVVRVSTDDDYYGVALFDSDGNVVAGNTSTGEGLGSAIYLSRSRLNEVRGNSSSGVAVGVENVFSGGNLIEDNRISRSAHTGIFVSGWNGEIPRGDVIRNNSITEYGYDGIYLGGYDHRVEGNSITGRGTVPYVHTSGIQLAGGGNSRLVENSISHTEEGIFCLGTPGNVMARNRFSETRRGILSQSCDGDRITGNRTADVGVGVLVALATDITVAGNVLRRSRHGITFFEAVSDSRIEDNVVIETDEEGIDAGGSRNSVVRNHLIDNGYRGIILWGERNHVARNVIRRSGLDGIHVGGQENRVERNLIRDSGASGVRVYAQSTRIEGNLVAESAQDGIIVREGARGALVRGNFTLRNADDGIDVDEPLATIARNTATRNGALGIAAVAGVTDGGGNRAFSNGNALQCLNLVCR